MRRAILPISIGLAGLGATVWFFFWIFEGQREDVALARAFLHELAAEDIAAAHARLSPAAQANVNLATLGAEIGRIEAWERLRFHSRSSEGFDPDRVTDLHGTGTTVTGCTSRLFIRVIQGAVDAFEITPLCPETGVDA